MRFCSRTAARVRIKAAPEQLAKISMPGAGSLVRIAWHLGNRHLPVMLAEEHILIRRDHVIEDMVRGLGARSSLWKGPSIPRPAPMPDTGIITIMGMAPMIDDANLRAVVTASDEPISEVAADLRPIRSGLPMRALRTPALCR